MRKLEKQMNQAIRGQRNWAASNTTVIKTYLGRTIMVQWDETSPRPYTRLNLIQGTKGVLAGGPTRAAFDNGFEGYTEDPHEWIIGEGIDALYEKYDHPMYKRLHKITQDSGHGGMDGMMVYLSLIHI